MGKMRKESTIDTSLRTLEATTHAVAAARGGIMMVGCVGMMLQISPQLCAVGLAAFPAAALLSQWSGRRIKERQKAAPPSKVAAAKARPTSLMEEPT